MTRNAALEEELSEVMKQTETLRSLGEDRTRKQASELARQEKVRPSAAASRPRAHCFPPFSPPSRVQSSDRAS